jgi:hypothetical protein
VLEEEGMVLGTPQDELRVRCRLLQGLQQRDRAAVSTCSQVAEAIARQLPAGSPAGALVFTGPGGGSGVAAGARTALSRDNLRRAYHAALARVTDPSAQLGYTPRRVLRALRGTSGVG